MKKIASFIFLCVSAGLLFLICDTGNSEEYGDAESSSDSIAYYYEQGDFAEAIRCGLNQRKVIKKSIGKNNEEYLRCLYFLATTNYAIGIYPEAISFYEEGLKIAKQRMGGESVEYIMWLSDLATCKSLNGDYKEAVSMGREALQIKNVLSNEKDSLNIQLQERLASYIKRAKVDSLMAIGAADFTKGRAKEAMMIFAQAQKVCEKEYGKESIEYANVLTWLALSCKSVNRHKAITLGEQAKGIWDRTGRKYHLEYATILNNLSDEYFNDSNIRDATRIKEDTRQVLEKIRGKNHLDYANSLMSLAVCYFRISDHKKSIQYSEKVLQLYEKIHGKNNEYYETTLNLFSISADSLILLSKYNCEMGEYKEAIDLGMEVLNARERVLGKKDMSDVIALNILASSKNKLNDVPGAIKLNSEGLKVLEEIGHNDSIIYIKFLHDRAVFKTEMGNYDEALQLFYEVCDHYQDLGMENSIELAVAMTNWAHCLSLIGCYDTALEVCNLALGIWKKHDKNDVRYAALLSNLASCYSLMKKHNKAICVGKKALKMQEGIRGKENADYAYYLNNLASYYYCAGNHKKAIRLGTEALQIVERMGSGYKNTPEYAMHQLCMMMYHDDLKDIPSLEKYVRLFSDVYHSHIKKLFSNCTEYERNALWCKTERLFTNIIPRLSYLAPTDKLVKCGYDATLFSKGILFNLTKDMSELILESKDAHLMQLYKDIKINHQKLQMLYEKPIAERLLNTDSLEAATRKMEQELIGKSKVYGDFTKNININWKDVRNKLGNNDVAIDFVSFPLNQDSTMYIAYVLQKGMTAPKMIPLFEERQLKKDKMLYKNTYAGKLIWEHLSAYLEGKENVYFAPSGELYNIAIESIPHWDGKCRMSDKWNMYRLSSTRELALIKDKKKIRHASVYGGVKYDTQEEALIADSRKYQKKRNLSFTPTYQLADSLNMRSGVRYLPATREEAIKIDNTLTQKHINVVLKIDDYATEGDFKNLDGKKDNLIHIATHGFYWTEREAKYMDNINFLMANNSIKYMEDKALTRSGLLFAGANNTLSGKHLPEGVDDGILTANEISKLDLRGADLVVLSACQTGIGEIKGDGVFGLQRGFKKAGVQSILMSLWKVDDEATMLLMTQFYKNLTSKVGMSKHEALKQAQKYVREYDGKKYQDPYYWAAFILLDAID